MEKLNNEDSREQEGWGIEGNWAERGSELDRVGQAERGSELDRVRQAERGSELDRVQLAERSLRRIRRWITFFIVALVLSGVTAFALETEMSWLAGAWPFSRSGALYGWVERALTGTTGWLSPIWSLRWPLSGHCGTRCGING